jgi:hypothetical protein
VSLDPSATSIVAVSGAAAGAIGLILGVVAQIRLRRLRHAYAVLRGGDGRESLVDAAARTGRQVEALRGEVAVMSAGLEDVRTDLADAIRHVAVVRYDAFGDMGGRLSFSAALLDDSGDGLVFSSINGRSETRTYAKGVKAGNSEAQLSPEEEQVVSWALRGHSASPSRAGKSARQPRGPQPPKGVGKDAGKSSLPLTVQPKALVTPEVDAS